MPKFEETDHPRDDVGRFSASAEGATAGAKFHEGQAAELTAGLPPPGTTAYVNDPTAAGRGTLGAAHGKLASTYRAMSLHYERGNAERAGQLHKGLEKSLKELRKLEHVGGFKAAKPERAEPGPATKQDITRVLGRAAERGGASSAQVETLARLIHNGSNAQREYNDWLLNTSASLTREEASAMIDYYMRRADDEAIAFDFDPESVRNFDTFGRMHVKQTPLTKAAVNEYYGHEIPNAEKLGLDPQRKYKLLRDPDELKKAVPTANNQPVMARHVAQSPDDPHRDKIVGTTGTDADYEHPYLRNSMAFWTRDGIDGVETNKKRQISASYSYDPDMTPGVYEGEPYDGVMRNIKFNHFATVTDGRAGPDVLVEDSMPPELQPSISLGQESLMTISRKALLARGALSAYLKPKLAQDAKIDLKAVLLGTTAANWSTAKPEIARRLTTAAHGKLAKDATLADMHEMLDSLDKEGEGEPDTMDAEPESEEDKRKKEAADKAARDEEAETEEEKKERMEKRARDKAAKDKAARDEETPEEKEKREREEKDAKDKAARDRTAKDNEPKPITKAAMDAAIADAVAGSERKHAALRDAERAVEPLIGKLAMPQEGADAVYRLALDHAGVKHTGVHPSALPAMVEMAKERARDQRATPRLATDAAAAKSFAELTGASRIRTI
jgi:hypothetical protein